MIIVCAYIYDFSETKVRESFDEKVASKSHYPHEEPTCHTDLSGEIGRIEGVALEPPSNTDREGKPCKFCGVVCEYIGHDYVNSVHDYKCRVCVRKEKEVVEKRSVYKSCAKCKAKYSFDPMVDVPSLLCFSCNHELQKIEMFGYERCTMCEKIFEADNWYIDKPEKERYYCGDCEGKEKENEKKIADDEFKAFLNEAVLEILTPLMEEVKDIISNMDNKK